MKGNFTELAWTIINGIPMLNSYFKFSKLIGVSYFKGNQFPYSWSQESR